MTNYNTDQLLDDVLQDRGALRSGEAADKGGYQQVWDAFNRYVTATITKRQTLEVPNFCKIGWRVEHYEGKAKYRPHFQLADSFVRVHHLDASRHATVPDTQLAPVEDFNYSKAAIRYSQGLTKANMFAGLRAIAFKIGEACTRQQVSIEFEMGQLLCNERVVHFAFVGELYKQEGLEVPTSALADVAYRPSRTFAPATADGLTLSVRGRKSGAKVVVCSPADTSQDGESAQASQCGGEDSGTISSAEYVRRAALERHLEDVKSGIAEAEVRRVRDENYIQECASRETTIANIRKDFYKDHKEELRRQMRELQEKREAGRENAVTQASQHDFPCFREDPNLDNMHGYLAERKQNLREDLLQQVSLKHQVKTASKQQDKELTANAVEASEAEIQRQKAEEKAKKELSRSVLRDAWERSIRLKQVQTAIDSHHLTAPAAKSNLPKVAAELRKNMPSLALQAAKVPSLALQAAQRQQSLETGGDASSRPPTGSARRVPIGAAASLALHRRPANWGAGPKSART